MNDKTELKERLEEVLEEYGQNVEYCLKCDEAQNFGENELDCLEEHYEHILNQWHDSPTIESWINCIEFIEDM